MSIIIEALCYAFQEKLAAAAEKERERQLRDRMRAMKLSTCALQDKTNNPSGRRH